MGSRVHRWIGIAAIAAVFGVSAPAASETVIQVSNTAELVSALSTVPNGGVVELLSGTYLSPSSGFSITNATREFTVRAANTQSAILDGQGIYPILKLEAASPLTAGWVSFEGLVFQNGFSDDDVLAMAAIQAFETAAALESEREAEAMQYCHYVEELQNLAL